MINPFRCNSGYRFFEMCRALNLLGSLLNARKCLAMRCLAPRSA